MLKHGGNLREAALQYEIPLADWLDLSTGINPQHYPIAPIHPAAWQRLPEDNDGLVEAACSYYGCQSALPTAGSQAVIQVLPCLRLPLTVAMPRVMYQEHAYAWQQNGHHVIHFEGEPDTTLLATVDVLLICNPNNPTGQRFSKDRLLSWYQAFSARNGWLVVDEAFMDVTPEDSLANMSHLENLFVLRSLGKFFGLAGARVGFVLGHAKWLAKVQEALGPWSLTGPSRIMAKKALSDVQWQVATQRKLIEQSERLKQLLESVQLNPVQGTALFQYVETTDAVILHQRLAKLGIWVRLFESPTLALRFGLPAANAWNRLASALKQVVND